MKHDLELLEFRFQCNLGHINTVSVTEPECVEDLIDAFQSFLQSAGYPIKYGELKYEPTVDFDTDFPVSEDSYSTEEIKMAVAGWFANTPAFNGIVQEPVDKLKIGGEL